MCFDFYLFFYFFSPESKGFSYTEQFGWCNRERRADFVGHLPNHQAIHHHDTQYTPNQNQKIFFFYIQNPFLRQKSKQTLWNPIVAQTWHKLCFMLTAPACAVLSSQPAAWEVHVNALLSLRVCTHPSALGKISFGIYSLSHKGYAEDQLGCSSSALNFNKPLDSVAQQPGEPKPCWAVDTNQLSPPATWE